MPDFTSALYLGLRHAPDELGPWRSLTTGRPAAAGVPLQARVVAAELAALMGCARGLLAPSTLHLFFDVFDVLAREPIVIYAEKNLYPVMRWGLERAAAKGAPVRGFPAGNADALAALMREERSGRRPVVVADGLRPARGATPPLADYVALVRARRGFVVVDDTQALGVIGRRPEPEHPYGRGGGGIGARFGLAAPELIIGASLAKGFGAPLAVVCGAAETIDLLEAGGETRTHCSPPSLASLAAAAHALAVNRRRGDALRLRLAARVKEFRRALQSLGLAPSGGLFPVQTLTGLADPIGLRAALQRRGVSCVAIEGRGGLGPALSFLITASHGAFDIAACARALAQANAFQPGAVTSSRS
jgi:8-amino-7-oxononanoate synthase